MHDRMTLCNDTINWATKLGERNIWCKETCFNLATHVPLFIRSPAMSAADAGRKETALVRIRLPTLSYVRPESSCSLSYLGTNFG